MIKREELKSCCGGKSIILRADKAIQKEHLAHFIAVGYTSPAHFANSNIFYVEKNKFIVTGSFGSSRFNAKCSNAPSCEQRLTEFEVLLTSIL